eukprot:1185450-Prorocentrum_minimum.AAC.2
MARVHSTPQNISLIYKYIVGWLHLGEDPVSHEGGEAGIVEGALAAELGKLQRAHGGLPPLCGGGAVRPASGTPPQYSTVQYSTVQYSSAQFSQYNTVHHTHTRTHAASRALRRSVVVVAASFAAASVGFHRTRPVLTTGSALAQANRLGPFRTVVFTHSKRRSRNASVSPSTAAFARLRLAASSLSSLFSRSKATASLTRSLASSAMAARESAMVARALAPTSAEEARSAARR